MGKNPVTTKLFLFLIVIFVMTLGSDSLAFEALKVPPGFKITVFAEGLGTPRFFATSPDGVLFVTLIAEGAVFALPDKDMDGKADEALPYLKGLRSPHGIAFHDGHLYVGETHQVIRVRYRGFREPPGKKEVIVPSLPTGGHFTRTIGFGPDGKLYLSIGSSCNVCRERDRRRAAIIRYNSDGTGEEVFAEGLRNAVGIAWHPETGELWVSDNGRDWLGDDLPPDEINIVKKGRHYGWPYCYGSSVADPSLGNPEICVATEPPVFEIQAHSAPLGIAFYTGKMFPEEYKGDLFVALHGSWNRSSPTGYKVIRIKLDGGKPVAAFDFVSGLLRNGSAEHRPVDVHVGLRGEMYISDDKGGMIYMVTYGQFGR